MDVNGKGRSIYSAFTGGVSAGARALSRLLPEPKSRLAKTFSSVLSGIGGALGAGTSAIAGGAIQSDYAELISKQLEVQQQMMLVSFVSNIEKSKHETEMAAVRNIRAS